MANLNAEPPRMALNEAGIRTELTRVPNIFRHHTTHLVRSVSALREAKISENNAREAQVLDMAETAKLQSMEGHKPILSKLKTTIVRQALASQGYDVADFVQDSKDLHTPAARAWLRALNEDNNTFVKQIAETLSPSETEVIDMYKHAITSRTETGRMDSRQMFEEVTSLRQAALESQGKLVPGEAWKEGSSDEVSVIINKWAEANDRQPSSFYEKFSVLDREYLESRGYKKGSGADIVLPSPLARATVGTPYSDNASLDTANTDTRNALWSYFADDVRSLETMKQREETATESQVRDRAETVKLQALVDKNPIAKQVETSIIRDVLKTQGYVVAKYTTTDPSDTYSPTARALLKGLVEDNNTFLLEIVETLLPDHAEVTAMVEHAKATKTLDAATVSAIKRAALEADGKIIPGETWDATSGDSPEENAWNEALHSGENKFITSIDKALTASPVTENDSETPQSADKRAKEQQIIEKIESQIRESLKSGTPLGLSDDKALVEEALRSQGYTIPDTIGSSAQVEKTTHYSAVGLTLLKALNEDHNPFIERVTGMLRPTREQVLAMIKRNTSGILERERQEDFIYAALKAVNSTVPGQSFVNLAGLETPLPIDRLIVEVKHNPFVHEVIQTGAASLIFGGEPSALPTQPIKIYTSGARPVERPEHKRGGLSGLFRSRRRDG